MRMRPRWNGETAMMIAAGAGSPEAVKRLAAHGANVNAVERRKGQGALMWARRKDTLTPFKPVQLERT